MTLGAHRRKIVRRCASGLAVVALTSSLTGCLGAADDPTGTPSQSAQESEQAMQGDGAGDSGSAGPKVLVPGKPGEAARTGGPDDVPTSPEFNHSDVAYVQMMIPHHTQALEMTALARTRASDQRVRTLAKRISAAQRPEIVTMADWLKDRNVQVPDRDDDPMEFDHGSHGHDTMMGMLTERQLQQLAAADGARFDRLFLEGMIGHHQGAVDMAGTVAGKGSDIQVNEMAQDVIATQTAEIQRMRGMLR